MTSFDLQFSIVFRIFILRDPKYDIVGLQWYIGGALGHDLL